MVTKIPRGHRKSPLNHEPDALSWAIQKSGYTQAQLIDELAKRDVKVSKGQLSEMVKGTRNCRQPLLEAIAVALNCPVVVLEHKRDAA